MKIAKVDPGIGHFIVSIVKSVIRIIAAGFLIYGNFLFAGVLFILAEVLGIIEEIVQWQQLLKK